MCSHFRNEARKRIHEATQDEKSKGRHLFEEFESILHVVSALNKEFGINLDFSGIDLSHYYLNNLCLEEATFSYSNLEGAILDNSNCTNVSFVACNLEGSYFRGMTTKGINLKNAKGEIIWK